MEHFTQSITDDFADYNGNRATTQNGIPETTEPGEGETAPILKDIDIDAILNRTPIRRHRRSRPLEEAPEFVQRLTSFVEAKAGDDVVFTCQWKAFPLPSVHWYRDDEDITNSTDPRHERSSALDGTETLKLCSAGKKDEGAYKCRVENQEGVAATTGYLSVSGDVADKTLSTQHKKSKSDHSISSAPHLRTIVEQKSVEEREAEKARGQDPSPIQTFIDNFRREKTWPMHGTGYDPNDDTLSTGSSADMSDLSSLSSEPTTPDVEDYNLVSFHTKSCEQTQNIVPNNPPQNPNNLTVESLIKAPSIEDIMGEIEEQHLANGSEEKKLKCQQEYDSNESDTCPTPTNFLDEPEFASDTELKIEEPPTPKVTPEVPKLEIQEPRKPQIELKNPKKLVRSSNTFDADDDIPSQKDSPVPKIESQESLPVKRVSPVPKIELREIPEIVTRVLADQLDRSWVYYFLFTTCCASFAVATEMPVPYFVLCVAIASLISFRCSGVHNV